jgi:hypothetical protein
MFDGACIILNRGRLLLIAELPAFFVVFLVADDFLILISSGEAYLVGSGEFLRV